MRGSKSVDNPECVVGMGPCTALLEGGEATEGRRFDRYSVGCGARSGLAGNEGTKIQRWPGGKSVSEHGQPAPVWKSPEQVPGRLRV